MHDFRGQKVAFFTENSIYPVHNGSSQVYASLAEWMRAQGAEVLPISFVAPAQLSSVKEFYGQHHDSFCLLPKWSGGSWRGPSAWIAREIGRNISGSVYSDNAISRWLRKPERTRLSEYIDSIRPDVLYFNKILTVMRARDILLSRKWPVTLLDCHDDFVLREACERAALRSVIHRLGMRFALRHCRNVIGRAYMVRFSERRSRADEQELMRQIDQILVTSVAEYDFYRSCPGISSRVQRFSWPTKPQQNVVSLASAGWRAPSHDIGLISAHGVPNIEGLATFAQDILPLIRRQRPLCTVLIVGAITKFAREILRGQPGITFVDRVEQLSEFYDSIKVSVVSLTYGTGVSVRATEAVQYGARVVSTPCGARGLDPAVLARITVADDPQSFADAVCRLLSDEGTSVDPGLAFIAPVGARSPEVKKTVVADNAPRAGAGIDV